MLTPDKTEFPAIAREIAEDFLKDLPQAYEHYVKEHQLFYRTTPDLNDFLVWLGMRLEQQS